jgi:hypothetical protein
VPSQLRIYTIQEGRLDEFVDAWTGGVAPLRRREGYRIDGAWVDREGNRFVWILSYEGPEDWNDKDEAYYALPERRTMEPDPARLIVTADKSFISPIR